MSQLTSTLIISRDKSFKRSTKSRASSLKRPTKVTESGTTTPTRKVTSKNSTSQPKRMSTTKVTLDKKATNTKIQNLQQETLGIVTLTSTIKSLNLLARLPTSLVGRTTSTALTTSKTITTRNPTIPQAATLVVSLN